MAVERLACGRDLDQVWDGLGRDPDEHERDCPTCEAARASMALVDRATAQLRSANDAPELKPPPGLAASIKALARSQVRRDRTFVVARDSEGEVTASEWAVVQTIRRVLEPMPDLWIQRVKITNTDHGGLALTIRIVLMVGSSAPEVAERVRSRAEREMVRQLRQAVDRVDVEVGDVREP